MRAHILLAALASLAFSPVNAAAQPADLPIPTARSEPLPPGIKVGKLGGKSYYFDDRGHVLYGMDMRVLLRSGSDPAQHCTGECAKTWEPKLAPSGAQPNIAFPQGFGGRPEPARAPGFFTQPQNAPDWTIIAGAQGPQWVYKGWHMVFTRRSDGRSDRYDGAEDLAWNTLKFVPPVPALLAPADVHAVAVGDTYVLADSHGRHLFAGKCGMDCANWLPYRAGMASAALGDWRVSDDGDSAQWTWRGNPVFICADDAPTQIPAGGKALTP